MAKELKTTLGFEAEPAIATLRTLANALNRYTIAMARASRTTGTFNKAASHTDAQFKKQAATMKRYSAAQGTVTSKSKQTKQAIKGIGDAGQDVNKRMKRLAATSKKTSQQMILSWQSVIRIFTIQVIHQMISKVTSAMQESISTSMNLEIRFAEIQTIGGRLKNNFEGISSSVRELSDDFGITTEIVAEGVYQTLSNQVAQAEDAFAFFAAAADFSVAAVTSADASVNLLTSTINAFGYNASQTTLIAGKLFKTIELGRVRGEEFANTFGRVAVLASRLGIALEEVLASIATLTISGLRYNEAFTLINNIMLKLIRPTEAMKKELRDMGIVTIEAGIQAYGFQGILAELSKRVGSSASELGELFGRVRAIRGALGLTGTAAKTFTADLKAIQEAGAETLLEAKKLIFKTNAKKVQIEIEKLRNAVVIDFGRKALGVINNIIERFGGLINIVKILGIGLGVAGIGFLALAVAAHPVILTVGAIAAAVSGLIYTYEQLTKTALKSIEERENAELKTIAKINIAEAKLAEERIAYFRVQFSELQKYLIGRLEAVNQIKKFGIDAEAFISEDLNKQLSDRRSAFNRFVSGIVKSIEQGRDSINKVQKSIFSLQLEMQGEIFEGQKRGKTETRQILSNIQRASELAQQASREFRSGYQDRARLLFTESRQLLNQAKSLAANIDNYRLERIVRQKTTGVIQTQINLQQKLIKNEASRQKSLEAQLPIETARAKRISYLVNKIKEFAIFTKEGIIQYGTEKEAIRAVTPLLDSLQAEFDEAGAKFNIFKRLEETGSSDLTTALTLALKPLEDVFTGLPVTLRFAYKERAKLIFKDIQKIADEIPIDIKLRLEKLGFDVSTLKGIEEASKGLVKTFQAIERSVRASSSLKGEQEKLDMQMESVVETSEAIRDSIIDQIGVLGVFKVGFKDMEELTRRIWNMDAKVNEELRKAPTLIQSQVNLMDRVVRASTLAKQQITGTFDPIKFKVAVQFLESIKNELKETGETDAPKNVQALIDKLKIAAETAQNIKRVTAGTEIQFGEMDIKRLEEIFVLQDELTLRNVQGFQNIGSAAQISATTANTAFTSMQTGLSNLEIQAKRTAAAVSLIGGGNVTEKHLGGLIYRQYGGFTPKGTDTIPAMLSPGEFVVNSKSTKKFFSQLVAMNAGVRPVFRQEGGPVTNVGDINITVQGAPTPQQTARETMTAFRREMRRRTSNLS